MEPWSLWETGVTEVLRMNPYIWSGSERSEPFCKCRRQLAVKVEGNC